MAKGYEGLIPLRKTSKAKSKESEGRTQKDAQGKRMDDEGGSGIEESGVSYSSWQGEKSFEIKDYRKPEKRDFGLGWNWYV